MVHVRQIVLASASPRRRQLLAAMGLSFQVCVSQVSEAVSPGEYPDALAARLSAAKAEAVAQARAPAIIIAADTLVVLDGRVMGKPPTGEEAFAMLARLRRRRHTVLSGLALIDTQRKAHCVQLAETHVYMRDYTDEEIGRYVDTGDPMDKAGAYAIQDPRFSPVDHVDWCYANVMGLPMCHLYRVLSSWGVNAPHHPLKSCPYAVDNGGCPWAAEILDGVPNNRSVRTD